MHKRQAKKKAQSGNEDSINYYKRVSDTLREGFPTADEKDLFLDNVFHQLETEAIDTSQALVTSHIVEELISQGNSNHISTLVNALKPEWLNLCCHRFGSHVIQTLVSVLPNIFRVDHGDDDTVKESLEDSFVELCSALLSDVEKFIEDVYCSHVMRMVLNVLGGIRVEEHVLRSRASRNQKREKLEWSEFETPVRFKKLFKKLAKAVFQTSDFEAHLLNEMSNPVVQTIILIMNRIYPKKCQKYVQMIIQTTNLYKMEDTEGESSGLPDIVQHGIGSFLVEQILVISNQELLEEIYNGLFKGRILKIAVHPVANFILQRYIEKMESKEQFEEIVDELSVHTEDMLAMNCLGVINKILQGCLRFHCKQKAMLKGLMAAFHCESPVERQTKLVPLIASLSTYQVFYNMEDEATSTDGGDKTQKEKNKIPLLTEVNYHGALVLQHLLKCDQPRLVISSLLDLKPVELKIMSCDPCGSHVIDVFFNSNTVGEKSKDLLLNKYQGLLTEVACTKNGSRTLETIWRCLKTKQKVTVAEELVKHEDRLRSDKFGHFVYYNFNISHFRMRRNDWMEIQGARQKKRKIFEDIIEDTKGGKPSKKTKNPKDSVKGRFPASQEAEKRVDLSLRIGEFPAEKQKSDSLQNKIQKDKSSSKDFHKKKTFKDVKRNPKGTTKTFKIRDVKHKELLEKMRPNKKRK